MMAPADAETGRFLGDYLAIESPARLFVVGELPAQLLAQPVSGIDVHYLADVADAERMATPSSSEAVAAESVPNSLILQIQENMTDVEQCLGQAVRAFPHRVLVHIRATPDSAGPGDELFFSLGFRRLAVDQIRGGKPEDARWFEYRLSQYKLSPDWLNARFWANPERFDADDDPDIYCEESDDAEDDDDQIPDR